MIMRDVNNGWAVRYTHANVASFFFIFVYALNLKIFFSKILFLPNLHTKIINNFKDVIPFNIQSSDKNNLYKFLIVF